MHSYLHLRIGSKPQFFSISGAEKGANARADIFRFESLVTSAASIVWSLDDDDEDNDLVGVCRNSYPDVSLVVNIIKPLQ